jgi:hypothetical protein
VSSPPYPAVERTLVGSNYGPLAQQAALLEVFTDGAVLMNEPQLCPRLRRFIPPGLTPMSVMSVPISTGSVITGAITIVALGSNRRYDTDHLAVATDLAYRAAAGLENARLFHGATPACFPCGSGGALTRGDSISGMDTYSTPACGLPIPASCMHVERSFDLR